MTEVSATATDTRPAIVICAWSPQETGWDPVEDLSGEPWSPTGARTEPVAAADPEPLAETLEARLADRACRALLLVGRAALGDAYLLQIRAEKPLQRPRTNGLAPSVVRATAPAPAMVRALKAAGLSAQITSDAQDDAGSYLLHRILTAAPAEADVPAVALLRAPAAAPDEEVQRAVKVVAQAIAERLSPLPRMRTA